MIDAEAIRTRFRERGFIVNDAFATVLQLVLALGKPLLIEGPANIGRLVSGPNSWKWYPVAASSSGDGQMGWTVGEAVISTPDGHAGPSKYLTIWRRQRDGSVRYITDGGNGR